MRIKILKNFYEYKTYEANVRNGINKKIKIIFKHKRELKKILFSI